MRQVRLTRIESDPKHGTFGVLTIDGVAFCSTLEPYGRDNAVGISSIPANQYVCKPYTSPRYPYTWEVCDIQGRSKVLFHAGNIDDHTQGCILLGQYFGKLRGNRAVLNSGKTFEKFIALLEKETEFKLTIVECY